MNDDTPQLPPAPPPPPPSPRPAVEAIERQKASTIAAMLGASLVFSILNVALNPDLAQQPSITVTQLIANVTLMLLGFRWLHLDSAQLEIRRPIWLNVGIILLAIVFVPYYLYKTRQPGARQAPILGFLGLVVAIGVASAVGGGLMMAFSGTPAPTGPGI
ncbi:hypothetical protein ACQQ2N_10215 [Dokdonella sp. MW10]|uniref:hypothetical protein n=1 Tax=Dokdonella sp. MW10 TaxID=2992926 RepID=UPI003F7E7EE1